MKLDFYRIIGKAALFYGYLTGDLLGAGSNGDHSLSFLFGCNLTIFTYGGYFLVGRFVGYLLLAVLWCYFYLQLEAFTLFKSDRFLISFQFFGKGDLFYSYGKGRLFATLKGYGNLCGSCFLSGKFSGGGIDCDNGRFGGLPALNAVSFFKGNGCLYGNEWNACMGYFWKMG